MNSDNQTVENGRNDEAIGRLLRLAGEPQAVPEATMARSRAKVREHWQDTLAARQRTVTRTWSGRLVAMAASLTAETVGPGYQLRLALDSGAQQEKIATHGEGWDWTFETASDFDLDGKSTAEFLEWLCHEQGWTLEYANLRVRQNAEKAIIHGSIKGLSAEDALSAVLRTLRMDFAVTDGVLEIDEQASAD